MRIPIRSRSDRLDVKMTPMIDVVFLLLIFFVWTASFQIVEESLPSALSEVAGSAPLPAAAPPPEADFPEVVIRIGWNGRVPSWLLNQRSLNTLEELRDQLQQIHQVNAAAPVVIHPDEETPFGDVIDVYDVSRLAGFSEVQFAVSAGATPGVRE